MRPRSLYPLFTALTALPGVGPRLEPLFEKLAGPNPVDLLWHLPQGVIDRRFMPTIAEAPHGRVATLHVTIRAHQPPDHAKRPYRVIAEDETGTLILVYFHARPDWLQKLLPVGSDRIVSGVVEHFKDERHMAHPDHAVPIDRLAEIMTVEPVYPLTAGLTLKTVTKAVRAALERAPELPEWLDEALVHRETWPSWRAALETLHHPESEESLSPQTPARRRLAYDELLANQLALALVRHSQRGQAGRSIQGDGRYVRALEAGLPFRLTHAQERSRDEILADLARPARMHRLLQGDVGSGKTVVALLAMAAVAETGAQAALMAPTEILARQHYATIARLAEPAGLRVALLTGRDKGAAREAIRARLAQGEIDILVGTHALFQDDVDFHDLALAVIDDQHRFGVHQRLSLAGKGRAVDMLVMTATPIPRTLVMTAYGDMDVSRLDEKPPGRRPIDTRAIPIARLDEVADGVARAVQQGARAYWVCPLIEESESSDLAAAEERQRYLAERLSCRIGLVHGRMKPAEKDKAMAAFADGAIDILVATTVIEVGVDVPEATAMVIEHAERFGLAQLHQLRGRIGRSERPSICLLLYGGPLGETGRARLNIIRDTEDGFLIAEEDLRLRGSGEILGTRQSGLPSFRIADLAHHGDLLAIARRDAQRTLETDPALSGPRGEALRTLLYLFRQDALVRTLRSG